MALNIQAVHDLLKKHFGDKILGVNTQVKTPFITIAADAIAEVGEFLRYEPVTELDLLVSLAAVDLLKDGKFAVVYHVESLNHKGLVGLRVEVPRDNPHVPTVSTVWKGADWHEREAYDLMGIVFDGHPNLVRILCPEDWEGHPLRKDYVQQKFYHGIPCE